MPAPRPDEEKGAFLNRCMGDAEAIGDFPDDKQRYAFCISQWTRRMKFHKPFEISKLDEDQRIAFGWASVIEKEGRAVEDLQGDIIEEPELEKAAYNYVLNARIGGDMHSKSVGRLIESMVFTKEKQAALGIDLGKVGWFVGFKIDDPEVWGLIKTGQRPMLSIGGRGVRYGDQTEGN